MANLPKSPRVSVILPAYNHAHFLPFAIESVLNQTFPDFEMIIIDDGSNDNTREVVQKFKDPRIQYFYQSNKGLSGARNTGLGLAKGEYIAFLDADDLFLPGKLGLQVSWLEANPDYGFVSGGWNVVNENGEILLVQRPWMGTPRLELLDWLFACPVITNSVLVRQHWVEKVSGFDPQLRRVEDWDFWLRLAYAGCKMGWVNEIVCSYRMAAGQMTQNAAEQKRVSKQVMEKFYSQKNLPASIQLLREIVLANCLVLSAGREFTFNQCDDAKSSIAEAVKLNPDLLGTKKDELILKLLSWADDPNIGNPLVYTQRVFDNLPPQAAAIRAKKRWALGEMGLRMFYKAYQVKDWKHVQEAAWIVARNAPQRMLNRGIWSILLQSRFSKTRLGA
jgi:GT2 family glycosyltransferase